MRSSFWIRLPEEPFDGGIDNERPESIQYQSAVGPGPTEILMPSVAAEAGIPRVAEDLLSIGPPVDAQYILVSVSNNLSNGVAVHYQVALGSLINGESTIWQMAKHGVGYARIPSL
jgi:hypothetical protein